MSPVQGSLDCPNTVLNLATKGSETFRVKKKKGGKETFAQRTRTFSSFTVLDPVAGGGDSRKREKKFRVKREGTCGFSNSWY